VNQLNGGYRPFIPDSFGKPLQPGDKAVLGSSDTIGTVFPALVDVDTFYNDQSNPAARPLSVIGEVAITYHTVSAREVSTHRRHHDPVLDSCRTYATFLEQMWILHVSSPGLSDSASLHGVCSAIQVTQNMAADQNSFHLEDRRHQLVA
jgi:hypothetical protein